MAAHEGSDHAEQAERRDIGDATLEQLRADVVRLSLESMTAEPFPVFREMRRLRSRIYAALDRQLWPRDQTELYFLLGALNCLMAVAASDMGYPQSGEELIRAAWAYATAIDHRPLMAHLRLELRWHRPLAESWPSREPRPERTALPVRRTQHGTVVLAVRRESDVELRDSNP